MTKTESHPAADAMAAVIRRYEAAEARVKEQTEDTIRSLKTNGSQAIVADYRYLFRNEAERDAYGRVIAAFNRDGRITLEAVAGVLDAEIERIKYDLIHGIGRDNSSCPVRNARSIVTAEAVRGVLDDLCRIKEDMDQG
jgi:hypothetical protein